MFRLTTNKLSRVSQLPPGLHVRAETTTQQGHHLRLLAHSTPSVPIDEERLLRVPLPPPLGALVTEPAFLTSEPPLEGESNLLSTLLAMCLGGDEPTLRFALLDPPYMREEEESDGGVHTDSGESDGCASESADDTYDIVGEAEVEEEGAEEEEEEPVVVDEVEPDDDYDDEEEYFAKPAITCKKGRNSHEL